MRGSVALLASMVMVLAAYLVRWLELHDRIMQAQEDGRPERVAVIRNKLKKETLVAAIASGLLLAAGIVWWIIRGPQ